MVYADKTLTCKDCGATFVFTQGEQEFYASKGLMNEPSRCPDCRRARRAAQNGSSYSNNGTREMYEVTCDSCGRVARVPFQPKGNRPVYCSDCYRQQRESRSSGYGY